MNKRPPALLTVWLVVGLLLTVLVSACASGPAETYPDNYSPGAKPLPASSGYQQPAPFVAGVPQLELAAYTKIPLEESQLEVSSVNHPSQDKDNLLQAGTEGYWHIKAPKKEIRSWVMADMETEQAVAALGIIGRKGTNQMWHGYRAVLEASNDKKNWVLLARPGLSSKFPKDEWTYFILPEPKPYRYYRLSIHDESFMSIARLAMYVTAGALAPLPAREIKPLQILGSQQFDLGPYTKIPLLESQLEVSSSLDPAMGKARLVEPGRDTFWHVMMPRQEERAWVLVDLGIEQPVTLVRVRPRVGLPEQMWYGYTAELEASNDKQNWIQLAVLGIPRTKLTDDWMYFLIGNLQPYRYYRLSIWDRYFYSMARLELYRFR